MCEDASAGIPGGQGMYPQVSEDVSGCLGWHGIPGGQGMYPQVSEDV